MATILPPYNTATVGEALHVEVILPLSGFTLHLRALSRPTWGLPILRCHEGLANSSSKGGKTPWPANVAAGRRISGPHKALRFGAANVMVFAMRLDVFLELSHGICAYCGAIRPLRNDLVH